MQIQVGQATTLSADVMSRVFQYRRRVFVEKLGWQLSTEEGAEIDQFDRSDTVYWAARCDTGEVMGTARLLPTTRPYLLGEIFPQLMGSHPVPKASDIWELSRFAATDSQAASKNALSQFDSPAVLGLLDSVLIEAARHGAKRLITVSPLGIERLLRRYGVIAHRAAPPMLVDGQLIFACWIEVEKRGPARSL